MQKLGSSMDFGQEAILGLAGDGLPDLSSALPEAAASLPQVPTSAKPAKAAGVKSAGSNDLMPPPALKAIYDRVAAEEGVPVNVLVAMGHTESRHRADIDGPQTRYGAAGGIMQYLPGMAAAHKINRYNPEESIRQAAKDLRERLANNKGDMANAVARHHAGDNPQQLGPKSREYAETILAKARRLAPVYEAEQAAMVKDASKLRESSREQAAEDKRREYYPAGGAKPATGAMPSLAGNGLFGFGEQLQQARQAAPYGDLGVMNGFNAGSTPAAQERSTTPVTPEAEAEVRAALTVLPAGQREALLQDKGWRGQVARTIWAKSERAKKLQHATGIGPKVGAPDPIITRDEIEASYQKSGYTPDQAAQLAMHDLAGHTDQVRASDFDFEGMQAARDSLLVQAGRDVKRGASNLRAMSEGLAGTVYGLMGADDAARSALEVATARMERTARENPALIGSYENIHGADDAIRYAVEAVAENLPMFVPSLASGGAGGLAARKAAQGIVSDMVAKVGRERALKELERRIMIGQVTGAATASVGMETGSIAGDIYQKTGRAEPWTALAGGIPAGLLDTIEPVMALRKIAGPVADGVAGSIIKRLGVESGKQFMAEAGTEGLQTIIENAAVLSAQNKQPLTPELLDGVVDAMLKGGIGGGVMGAGSEAVSGLRHDRRQPALDYGAATKAAFGDPLSPQQAAGNAPSGPIGRAVSKAQAAPVAPTFAADDDLDRPPIDESMFVSQEQEPIPPQPGPVPTTPAWGHQPAAELAGRPVEVGRKENFAADYPVPPAPDADAIADVDARVAAAREQASAAQRRQILDGVLSDSAVRNPVAKFAAELARAGYAQAMPSPAELATIERFSSAKDAFSSADHDASLQEPAAPNEMGNDEAADWRAQRDAEIMPGADASSTPSSNAGMQKNAGEAQLSTTLPASLKSLADATEKPGPFIKKLRKAGYTIRDADHERQLINQFKEYKANGTAATDTNTGNALAQAQPAGDAGRAERPAADAQPGRNADGSVDAGRRQRNDQAVAADGGAGKQPAGVKQGKNWHAKAKEVDLSRDTVRDAVARLGGIRKDEAMREWGSTLVEGAKSRIFGKPVFRAKGGTGMSLDKMREALAELGYLPSDSDINDLYEVFEQDSLHHVGQERRAAAMAQGAAMEGQAVPAGEAAAAMPERTLDNHPVYDPWYDFDPDAILPDDLNGAAASAGEIVGDEDAEMFEAITTRLHQVLGADEAEAITERAAIMADSGKNFFEAVLELINGRQEAESNTGAAEPAAEGGKAAEASSGQAGARAAADIQQGQPDAGRSADEAGEPGSNDAGILQSYDQAELDAREQAQRAAEARRQEEERAADRKRQADAEVGDFVLTGSDTMADQLAARGQGGLFDEAGALPDTADDARQSRLSNEPTASAASRIPAASGQVNASTVESQEAVVSTSSNVVFTDEAAEKARAILKSKLSQLNSGIDPEIMQAGITLAGYHIEKGARTFAAYAKAMIEDMGDAVKPYLKSWYMGVKYDPRAAGFTDMSPAADVDAADIDDITKESNDAPATSGSVEQDRGQPATAIAGQRAANEHVAAGAGRSTGESGRGASRQGDAGAGNQRVSGADDASGRAGGNQPVHQQDGQLGTAPGAAGRGRRSRGAAPSRERLPVDTARPENPLSDAAGTASKRLAREKKQRHAPADFIHGDIANIRATLPALLPEQQDDVLKAELRFASPDGHGMMFTNGTGTGKTFTGGGIAKRFELQGESSILAVAPSQDILKGWQAAMKALGVEAKVLGSTSEHGDDGMVLTTYANLGANQTLAERQWDLVIADESHKLMQSEDGSATSALTTLRAITHHPDALGAKARMILRDQISEMNRLANDAKVNRASDDERDWGLAAKQQAQADELARKIEARTKELVAEYKQQPRSKVVFLSATPFSYHFTLDYANGYLFNYGNGTPADSGGYNSGGDRERFYMQHLGYRMRYNKLTKPKAGVNSEVLERELHEKLRREGSLSGRKLSVKADYDRKFVLVDSGIGQRIDEALTYLREAKDDKDQRLYPELYEFTQKKFDYLSRMRLLEAIKAEHAVEQIRQHHALGRKVVVFHDYNSGGGFSPFNYDALDDDGFEGYQGDDEYLQEAANVAREQSAAANAMLADPETGKKIHSQVAMLKAKRPDIPKIDFSHMQSPLATLTNAFPNALVYNGTVPGKVRALARERFNQDGSGFDLIIVQSAAGEAGISLHDTTGKHQRVLINLGMPVRPVTAIQQEGRIYRVGQVTDAVIRYMTTGTGWEDAAFASKIASRAGTAENLGMGNEARALRQSFIDAYTNASEYPASQNDGQGGKQLDSAENGAMSPFERAKTYYYAQQKNTKRRDQREGKDYYATPEPVGMKMVELANLRPFERVLEPSAGHGAIARFFPENAGRTLVEPSSALAPRAVMASPGAKLVPGDFESLHQNNKYDAIVMNPPYGNGGSTAIAHVAKAAKHLRNGGRIVALIPRGGMADKRFDAWLYGDTADGMFLQADIALPGLAFENAGTSVQTRIVVLEKQTHPDDVAKLQPQINRDYSNAASIEELFDRIEHLQLGERVQPTVSEGMSLDEGDTIAIGGIDFEVRKGSTLKPKQKMGKEEFAQAAGLAKEYGGYYDAGGREFWFASPEKRNQWAEAFDRGDEPNKGGIKEPTTPDAEDNAAKAVSALHDLGLEEVAHTTGKGKKLAGYVVSLPIDQVKESIDPYAFRKGDGVFVRKAHAEKLLGAMLGTAKASIIARPLVRKGGGGSITVPDVNRILSRVANGWRDVPKVFAVQRFVDLPADAQQAAYQSGGNESSQGMLLLQSGEVYVIAENHDDSKDVEKTLFHEIVGHYALRRMTGATRDEQDAKMRELFHSMGGRMEVMDFANRHGFYKDLAAYEEDFKRRKLRPEQIEALLFDEMFAHYAETRPRGFHQIIKELTGIVRQWLRSSGWRELPKLNDADLALMLRQASNQIRTGLAVSGDWQAYSAAATMPSMQGLTVEDMREAFGRHALAEWLTKLEKAGRLKLKQRLQLPEQYSHLEKLIQAFANNGNITMYAANLGSQELVVPVLLHETFHTSVGPLLGTDKWNALLGELRQLLQHAKQNPNGKAGLLWKDAALRVQSAMEQGVQMNDELQAEELGAYAIEYAEQAPATWQRWVARLLGYVKAWVLRTFGPQLGRLTPEQLRALAIAALKDSVRTSTHASGVKFSLRGEETISISKGNFPGADARDSNIALGREAQRRIVSEHPTWAQRLRDVGLKGLRPTLSMLPGNAVVDLYRDKLPALEQAQRHGERLDGMRQTLQKEADETFRAWEKLPAEAADKMADLMHEATIWQLHPDQPAPDKLSKKWAAKHAQLAAEWGALPDDAQAVYRQVRDLYAKRTEQMFDALADRIGRMSGLGSGARSKMLADLRERFDKTLGEGPYFPLSRFGDYLVVAKRLDADGKTLEKVVLAAETEHEQRILQQDLLGRGFDVVELDKAAKNFRASSLGTDLSGFAAGLIDKLDGVEMSDDQRADILDDINQMLIDALPPASARKHFKHRKGVPGFSNDAVRAFVRSQASMASHIANITYQDRIDKALQDARKQAKQDQANVNELGSVVDEMEERAELARRFVAHPIANALTQLGFANFLGFSLSQGLLNLTQVPLLTYPALAAKFGEAKTHAAMRGAYAKVGRALTKKGGETWGDVRTLDDLDDDSRRILKAMEERGKLDLTMALDLVRGGAGPQAPGRSSATRAAQWVGRYSGWFNHISEAANRQVTAIAGYKLALGQGMSRDQAVDYVAKLLDDSQFNYAFSNRPRLLMSNAGRVIGLMHTFAINAMYRIGRNLYHAMGDWKTEDGREARSIMLRILTVQAAMAGLSSLPLLPLAGAAVGTAAHKATGSRVIGAVGVMAGVGLAQALVAGMGADDDEPWDFDAERRRILNDITGSRTVAELLDKGLLRALGMDVANRISMNDLLMRDVDTGFTSKPAQDWLDNAFLQSIGGAAYGAIKQYARATDMAMDGQYHRAVEAALPKFAADVLKASRYAREDVRVPVGPASAHKADATALDVARQALGFTPSTVAEVNSSERAQRKAVAQMQARRGELLKAWVVARLEKNADAEKAAVERIAKFNQTQRENGSVDLIITGADRMSKLRSQKRGVERREHGELFGKKYRGVAEGAGGVYGEE